MNYIILSIIALIEYCYGYPIVVDDENNSVIKNVFTVGHFVGLIIFFALVMFYVYLFCSKK